MISYWYGTCGNVITVNWMWQFLQSIPNLLGQTSCIVILRECKCRFCQVLINLSSVASSCIVTVLWNYDWGYHYAKFCVIARYGVPTICIEYLKAILCYKATSLMTPCAIWCQLPTSSGKSRTVWLISTVNLQIISLLNS